MIPLKLACMLIGPGIEQTLEYNCMHALIGKLLGLHHISPLLGLALYEAASVNQPGWISRVGRCGGSLSRACAKPGDVMQIRLLSFPPYYVFVFFLFTFLKICFIFQKSLQNVQLTLFIALQIIQHYSSIKTSCIAVNIFVNVCVSGSTVQLCSYHLLYHLIT